MGIDWSNDDDLCAVRTEGSEVIVMSDKVEIVGQCDIPPDRIVYNTIITVDCGSTIVMLFDGKTGKHTGYNHQLPCGSFSIRNKSTLQKWVIVYLSHGGHIHSDNTKSYSTLDAARHAMKTLPEHKAVVGYFNLNNKVYVKKEDK